LDELGRNFRAAKQDGKALIFDRVNGFRDLFSFGFVFEEVKINAHDEY